MASSISCWGPGKADAFPGEGGERGCQGAVVEDELSVEISKPQEGLDLLEVLGGRPVHDSRHLCGIHADA